MGEARRRWPTGIDDVVRLRLPEPRVAAFDFFTDPASMLVVPECVGATGAPDASGTLSFRDEAGAVRTDTWRCVRFERPSLVCYEQESIWPTTSGPLPVHHVEVTTFRRWPGGCVLRRRTRTSFVAGPMGKVGLQLLQRSLRQQTETTLHLLADALLASWTSGPLDVAGGERAQPLSPRPPSRWLR